MIVHKDPKNLDNILVRRVAAVQGSKIYPNKIWRFVQNYHIWPHMPFVLVKNQVWALADNKILDSEVCYARMQFDMSKLHN